MIWWWWNDLMKWLYCPKKAKENRVTNRWVSKNTIHRHLCVYRDVSASLNGTENGVELSFNGFEVFVLKAKTKRLNMDKLFWGKRIKMNKFYVNKTIFKMYAFNEIKMSISRLNSCKQRWSRVSILSLEVIYSVNKAIMKYNHTGSSSFLTKENLSLNNEIVLFSVNGTSFGVYSYEFYFKEINILKKSKTKLLFLFLIII